MNEFLISLLPASLFIFALHILFQEGYLMGFIGVRITGQIGEQPAKPLINCPVCMSSVWGLFWFFVALPIKFNVRHDWQLFPEYLLCLCGLNYIIVKLISNERTITGS